MRPMKRFLQLGVALLSGFGWLQLGAQEPTVTEDSIISLTGKLEFVVAFGRPGYGEDPRHDEREDYIALTGFPAVRGKWSDGTLEDKSTTRAQLIFAEMGAGSTAKAKQLRRKITPLIGKKSPVTITGKAMLAITGHHHEAILIWVQAVDLPADAQHNKTTARESSAAAR